jgi:16S rRNA (cytidine1402-2'-O)-methyltransferase
LYESPHRIIQLLEEIHALNPDKEVFLVKELTKMYQKSFKGKISDIVETFKSVDTRGEWVVILGSVEKKEGETLTLEDIKELSLPPKQKAKLLSKMTGKNIKEIYETLK